MTLSEKFFLAFCAVIFSIGLIVFIAVLTMFPIMWLWNWLVPSIFGLRTITCWEALGLSLLSGFLIKPTISNNKKKDD